MSKIDINQAERGFLAECVKLNQFLRSHHEKDSDMPDFKLSESSKVIHYAMDSVKITLTKNPEFDMEEEVRRRLDEMPMTERLKRMTICSIVSYLSIWTGTKFVLPLFGFEKIGILCGSLAAKIQSILAKFGIPIRDVT